MGEKSYCVSEANSNVTAVLLPFVPLKEINTQNSYLKLVFISDDNRFESVFFLKKIKI